LNIEPGLRPLPAQGADRESGSAYLVPRDPGNRFPPAILTKYVSSEPASLICTASTPSPVAELGQLLTGPNGRSYYLSSTFWGSALSQSVRIPKHWDIQPVLG
jgi:hypothetical protein